ncbi:MAG: hypothetical protein CMM56_09775 [Rhodospirillaceae bacterium]|nr:hypothetical protein [Rhodospirillaceae bacterium]
MRAITLTALLIFSSIVHTHHSRSHYSYEIQQIEGELVAVHWVNPHVGFTVKVKNEQGEEELWRVEGHSNLLSMQRGNVSSDVFTVGEHVIARGSPSIRRERDLLTTNLLLENGREILLSGEAEPYWGEQSFASPGTSNYELVDALAENRGLYRVWSATPGGVGQIMDFPFTSAAIAARENWNPVDNFAERCEPEGMPRIMRNPHAFEFVDNGHEIFLISELYDLVRTIHIGDSAPPLDQGGSPLGYSTGILDENTLTVKTTHINWPYFDNIGTPQSNSVEMLEIFTVSDDQTRLNYQLTVTDPNTFSRPAAYQRYWLALGEQIEVYDCQVY